MVMSPLRMRLRKHSAAKVARHVPLPYPKPNWQERRRVLGGEKVALLRRRKRLFSLFV